MGAEMTKYGQFCPVAKASEILAERWTPLILRELLLGSHRFNDLEHGLPRISRSLLAQRLRFLEQSGLVERTVRGRATEYHLTEAGSDLLDVIVRLGEWSHRWFNPLLEDEALDPQLLVWDPQPLGPGMGRSLNSGCGSERLVHVENFEPKTLSGQERLLASVLKPL